MRLAILSSMGTLGSRRAAMSCAEDHHEGNPYDLSGQVTGKMTVERRRCPAPFSPTPRASRTSTSLLSSTCNRQHGIGQPQAELRQSYAGSFPKLSAISAQAASNAARSINAVLVIFREMVKFGWGEPSAIGLARRLQRVLAPSNDTKHLIGKSSSSDLPLVDTRGDCCASVTLPLGNSKPASR